MKNAISPTGMVHAIESKNYFGTVVLCHHHYGSFMSHGFEVDWQSTNKPVTCKRCIMKITTMENNNK